MPRKSRIDIRLDPLDPKYQVWRIGDLPPIRLTAERAKEVIAIASKLIPQQERHAAGARIMLPTSVERLQ